MHAFAGVRTPDAGTVCWRGKALADYGSRERARHIGLLLQHEHAEFWGSVLDYVLLGRYPRSASAARMAGGGRAACACARWSSPAYPRWRRASTARCPAASASASRIAQLLAQEATCMLLDEPLAHLDLTYQARVLALMKAVAEEGRAVMMVLHDALWAARACSHVLLLDGAGRATSGPAARNPHAFGARGAVRLPFARIRGRRGPLPGPRDIMQCTERTPRLGRRSIFVRRES